jgi:dCMP deaminase
MSDASSNAVLAFVPVIHKGYIDFFRGQKGDIHIFGPKLIEEYVHLTRDLRVVDPYEMKTLLEVLLPGRSVSVANPEHLSGWKYELTVMPDDEVCRDVTQRYFPTAKIELIPVFLRWNRIISFKEFEVSPNRKITKEAFHAQMIDEAFKEAAKSADWWRQIGAIAVKDKKVIAASHNHHLPTDFHMSANGDPRLNFDAGQHQEIFTSIHAEADVIAQAAREGISLKGASLYTTTFPCPNCARLVGTAGFKTVYYKKGYSLLDAERILEHFKVEIVLVD